MQDGIKGVVCPQALPLWMAPQFEYIAKWATENSTPWSLEHAEALLAADLLAANSSYGLASIDPRASEDCLFLDVVVPQKVFDGAASGGNKAPVLV